MKCFLEALWHGESQKYLAEISLRYVLRRIIFQNVSMIRNAVQPSAIGAINAMTAILISLYKKRSYSQRLEMLCTDHTREVTGSSPVSPSGVNQTGSYT